MWICGKSIWSLLWNSFFFKLNFVHGKTEMPLRILWITSFKTQYKANKQTIPRDKTLQIKQIKASLCFVLYAYASIHACYVVQCSKLKFTLVKSYFFLNRMNFPDIVFLLCSIFKGQIILPNSILNISFWFESLIFRFFECNCFILVYWIVQQCFS